jgi:hypothetical protein
MNKRQMLIVTLLSLVLIGICCNVSFAENVEDKKLPPTADEQNVFAKLDQSYGWQNWIQTMSFESKTFDGKDALGFHIKPAWRWNRFEGTFDLAFFQNPWNHGEWQWGTPTSVTKPDIPNFVDGFAYHGDWIEVEYKKITDIDYGFGLLINDYHPFNPYRGFIINLAPNETTRVSYVASGEIFNLAPFEKNEYASLQAFRVDQSLKTAGLNWQLGLTGLHDSYRNLDSNHFPTAGLSYDLSLNNVVWCAPFWESARFENYGRADMAGVKGRLGLISYQVGEFHTQGKFIADFFGGRYEDLKWNSFNNPEQESLLSLDNVDAKSRYGLLAQLWVEVNPWLNLSAMHIDDFDSPIVYRLKGKIERLGLEYGFSFYDQKKDIYNYDWFIKDDDGTWSYLCHYYRDLDSKSRYDFEVGYKF